MCLHVPRMHAHTCTQAIEKRYEILKARQGTADAEDDDEKEIELVGWVIGL